MQHDAKDDREDEEDQRRVREADAGHSVHPKVRVRGRKIRDDIGAEEDLCNACIKKHGADRHGDRWQANESNKKSVEGSEERATDQYHDDDGGHRPAVHPEEPEQAACEAERRRDREVDLAGHDDQRHGEGHDRQLAVREPHVEKVVVGEELGRQHVPHDEHHYESREQRDLPACRPRMAVKRTNPAPAGWGLPTPDDCSGGSLDEVGPTVETSVAITGSGFMSERPFPHDLGEPEGNPSIQADGENE